MPDNPKNVIELRVNEIAQLFHTLDPFPFRERISIKKQKNISSVGRASLPTSVHLKLSFTFQIVWLKQRHRMNLMKPLGVTSPSGQLFFNAI